MSAELLLPVIGHELAQLIHDVIPVSGEALQKSLESHERFKKVVPLINMVFKSRRIDIPIAGDIYPMI